METDNLIKILSRQGARKPLPHPAVQLILWGGPALAYVLALGIYFGLRADLEAKLAEPGFLIELILLLLISAAASLATFCLSRPDGHQKPWLKYVALGLLVPWAITALANASGEFSIASLVHTAGLGRYDCPWHIALFSIPPAVALFFMARAGATIRCCWAGSMATFSVTSMAYFVMRLVEQNDNPSHLFVWHALPVMLLCLVGMIIGHFSLKWR